MSTVLPLHPKLEPFQTDGSKTIKEPQREKYKCFTDIVFRLFDVE